MATVRLWTDADVENDPSVKAVFDDIGRVRKSDFVNNLAIIGMASETNNLVTAMQVPVDRAFPVGEQATPPAATGAVACSAGLPPAAVTRCA